MQVYIFGKNLKRERKMLELGVLVIAAIAAWWFWQQYKKQKGE